MSGRERGQGSGFVLDGALGHVLTNAHVVAGARGVRCTFTDGRTFECAVLGVDAVTDLALLAVLQPGGGPAGGPAATTAGGADLGGPHALTLAPPLPAAPLGDSRDLDVGDWVVAVGNPFGLDNSVTLGIVSALRRTAAEVGIPDKRLDFIQTDAAINPGNSGGPLVNEFGEVVGISTAIRADAEGIGFAIPINTAKGIVSALAAGLPVQHPYVGIQMATQGAGASGSAEGVKVVRVVPGSPAEAAGLRAGDCVLACGGAPTRSARQLQAAVEAARVGELLQLRVSREGRLLLVPIVTGDVATRADADAAAGALVPGWRGSGDAGAGQAAPAAPRHAGGRAQRAADSGGYRQL